MPPVIGELRRTYALVFAMVVLRASMCLAEPGQLIEAAALQGAPAGAAAWRIRYETTDREGHVAQSTGVLIAPTGPAPTGGRDVIAWAHGTTGIAESCAPSSGRNALTSIPALAEIIKQGWAVVATDYPGLGTPGPHAYLVGEAAARAVLDSVRAARHVERAQAGSRFIAWGLSQGAHAALFTGQEARRYAPELQVVGVVAAAPPTDLVKNLGGGSNPMVRTSLTAFALESWSKVYHADASTIAKPMAQRVIHRLAATCGSEHPAIRTELQALRLRRLLADADLTTTEPWLGILETNSAGRRPAGAPLFVAQGSNDVVVAPDVTKQFVVDACGRGERVRFVVIPDGIHRTTATVSAPDALRWIADRFAGTPAPTDCPIR